MANASNSFEGNNQNFEQAAQSQSSTAEASASETQQATGGKPKADTKTKTLTVLKFGGCLLVGVGLGVAGTRLYDSWKAGNLKLPGSGAPAKK